MTTRSVGRAACVCACVAAALASVTFAQADQPEPLRSAQAAFELRLNGKLDDAKRLLEEVLSKNPDDAASHYELARLKIHMVLGNPRELQALLPEAQQSIDQAVEKDPDNAAYSLFAGRVGFFRGYLAMHKGGEGATEQFAASCAAFENAHRLEPGHRTVLLYLIELYGGMPTEMGGDSSKAAAFMASLDETNVITRMKARSLLDDVGVSEWRTILESHPGNTEVLDELGKAYLDEEDVVEAAKYFEEAVSIDPGMMYLFMDLGRYHVFGSIAAMQTKDQETLQTHLAAADKAISRYIVSEPSTPMKAYAMGLLAKVKQRSGQSDEAERLRKEAKAMDPHHSRATGSPPVELFAPPSELSQDHQYLARRY